MVDLSRKGQNIDLNALKTTACRKYGLSRAPKLVEMIAALPESDREALLPTSMCAIRARYNPYVEFILMGGTFMSLPADYPYPNEPYFIRNMHDALLGHTSANVEEAVAYSEHGAAKCIGMTIET
ncbi:hypothetical protein ACFX14_038742 [Malus domestica]